MKWNILSLISNTSCRKSGLSSQEPAEADFFHYKVPTLKVQGGMGGRMGETLEKKRASAQKRKPWKKLGF